MGVKVTGFDKLQRELKEAQEALREMDGELGRVQFDPADPASIQQAINHAEAMIDDRVGKYETNKIIGPLIEQMKEHFREGIIEKASEARLKQDESNG